MPENARRRTSRRGEVSQRDTYRVTPGIEPAARPVDSYAPSGGGGNLRALQEAMKSGKNLVENYAEYDITTDRIQRKEGAAAAKRGDEPVEDAGKSYLSGYYKVQGQSSAAEFETAASQYVEENWNQDPETFQKGLNQLEEQYLQDKPEAYLEGFVPQAEKVEQKVFGRYQQLQREEMTRSFLDNSAKGFSQQFTEIYQDSSLSSKERAKKARQALSNYQKEAKNLGIPRDRVTERIVNTVGAMAEKEADPDLMDMVHEPGQGSGIRVMDTKLAQTARRWEQQAIQAQQQEEEHQQELLKAAKEKDKEQLYRDFITKLDSIDPSQQGYEKKLRQWKQQLRTTWQNPENNQGYEKKLWQWKQQLRTTWQNPENNKKLGIALDPEDLESILGTIDDMLELGDFAEQTDVDVQTAYKRQVTEITTKDGADFMLKQLRSSKSAFTRDDYQSMVRGILNERQSLNNQQTQSRKRQINEFTTKRLKTLKEANTGIFSLDDGSRSQQDARRVAYANEEMTARVSAYREQNEDKYPSLDDLRKIWKEVKEDAYEQYPDVKLTGDTSGGEKNNGDGGNTESSEEDRAEQVKTRLDRLTGDKE